MQPSLTKLDALGLFGIGHYTLSIVDMCRRHGIRVAFVVDDCPEERPDNNSERHSTAGFLGWFRRQLSFWGRSYKVQWPDAVRAGIAQHGIPLWSMAKLRQAVAAGQVPEPILSSCITNSWNGKLDDDEFTRAVRTFQDLVGPSIPLLHPVTLERAIQLPRYRRRVGLVGFPGSGNMLTEHLIAHLLERLDGSVPTDVQLVAAFAEHYFVSVALYIREQAQAFRPIKEIGFGFGEMPTMAVTMALADGSFVSVQQVPSNRHLGQFFYHSHSTPSAEAVAEFERLQAPLFVVIRHPFDTVLSLASKVCRPPTSILDDPKWLKGTLVGLELWLRRLYENRSRVTILRYEDLVARKPEPVQEVAARLGVEVSLADIEALYDRLLFRNLVTGQPGHFYKGGTDRWKDYFQNEHIKTFAQAGFGRYFDCWGYEGLQEAESRKKTTNKDESFPPQMAVTVPVNFSYSGRYKTMCGNIPMALIADSPELMEKVKAIFGGQDMHNLLNAGGVGLCPPPWVRPLNWDNLAEIFGPENAKFWRERKVA